MRATARVLVRGWTLGATLSGVVPLAAVLALTGGSLISHVGSTAIGTNPSNDFQIMCWSLRFWPWAISHGQPLTHTTLLWSPTGFSTLWMTTIPLPSLVAAPLTLTAGPLVSYNALMLAAPALAGVAAFSLCRELTANVGASVVGGVSFGLSPYLLGHLMSEHLNLVLVFPLPLLGRAAVRLLRQRISRKRFVVTSAALLLAVLGCSLELFVDLTVIIVAAGVVMIAFAGGSRGRFLGLALAYGLAYAAIAPVLVFVAAVALTAPHGPVTHAPATFSTDLANLALPTPTLLLGSLGSLARTSGRFVGNIGERDGFLGPLLVGSAAAMWTSWRRVWPAAVILVIAVLLSLGPMLAAEGKPLLTLPSYAALPAAGDALPARFAVFASLAASVLTARWLGAASPHRRGRRLALSALVIVCVVPNFRLPGDVRNAWASSSRAAWSTRITSVSFAPTAHNVLVLPAGDRTAALWWQASSDMRFALAMPASPFVPPALASDPTIADIADDVLPQLQGRIAGAARLRSTLVARRIDTVVVTRAARRRWLRLVRRAIPVAPVVAGGAYIFSVPRDLPPLVATLALRVHGPSSGVPFSVRLRLGRNDIERLRIQAEADTRTLVGRFSSIFATTAPRRAAVSFVQWTGAHEQLRVATYAARRWTIATVAEATGPIWSAQALIAQHGPITAAWVQDLGAARQLEAAMFVRNGWTRPHLLDRGLGLGSFAAVDGEKALTFRWTDVVAGESRLLAAELRDVTWSSSTVLRTGSLGSLRDSSDP